MLTKSQLIGPWAGLPVAWTADGSFDERTYRGDVARCCAAGVPGVYTGGTTGEFYAQDFDEFQRIARATIRECRQGQTPVMIGCTSTHTLGVIRRARFARDHGADAIQVALPFWMEVPDRAVVPFFQEVSRAVPKMPMTIYETTRAKKTLTLAQFRRVHREIPAVIGVKSNVNTLGHTRSGCRALSRWFQVFAGENQWYRLGRDGVIGSYSSFVYQNPRIMLAVFDLRRHQQWRELKRWMDRYDRVINEGLREVSRAGCEDSAVDRMLGLSAGFLKTSLRCRGPYPSVTSRQLRNFQRWLKKNDPELLEL
ncbi:dihydrodipicolinate synthase family protein [bacterium]|nr:dihydrodipicolinate synthase family protein [bacterium]